MTALLLLFRFGFLFVSFSCLIALARISNTMLNKSGKSGHSCLVPDFRGIAFRFSNLSMMLAVGLYSFCYVEVCSFYSNFIEGFYHKWGLNLVKCFSASIEMIIQFLSSILLIWCITLIDLQMLNHPCIPEINPTWSWCMFLFLYCCIWFANILLRIFASMFIKNIGLQFLFLCCLCLFLVSGLKWLMVEISYFIQ